MEAEAQLSNDKIISLKGVDISQKNHKVLGNVDLDINKGEFIFLIGKNGSGKSSFLKTLYGELKLEEGEAVVSEIALKKIKRKRHQSWQSFATVPRTTVRAASRSPNLDQCFR